MLHRLTPNFILEQVTQGLQRGQFDALCLFVDISGFTPLTLALMEHGTEGAEVLAAVLDAVFEPLIDTVYAHGGFVAGFAGDAFKALFPTDRPRAYDHALAAAADIRRRLTTSPPRETRFGAFSFSGKACLAAGNATWEIWTDADAAGATSETQQRAAYLFGGAAIQGAMGLDPLTEQGDLLVAEPVIAGLAHSRVHGQRRNGSFLVDRIDSPPPPLEDPTSVDHVESSHEEIAGMFFPRHLLSTRVQGEFRRVTTVFLNFEQPIPPDEAATFQAELFRLLDRYSGFLCRVGQIGGKDNGQTLLLFWGAPTTSERDSARALGFILDLQTSSPVRIRAGVTTALAFAGFVGSARREEYTCHSSYVNLAARQMVAADWGQVWVDATTATRTTGFDLHHHGDIQFKGFADLQPVYLLKTRVDAARRAFYAGTMVGRANEIAQLQEALEPLARGEFGGIVLVAGEAGIGKSRLVHEALHLDVSQPAGRSVARDDYQVTLLQTDEILRRPLNPVRYGLRTLFRQQETDDETEARARFEAVLEAVIAATPDAALAEELVRVRSFLAALVDIYWDDSLYAQLEPELRYENTLRAVKTLICALSLQQPQVLILEDVHWLDSESQELLQLLVRNVESYPFLIVATQRTGTTDDGPDDTLDAVVKRRITLSRLDPAALQSLGAELLGGQLAGSLAADLVVRADGNPFFAEQIMRYLQEEALLEEGADGWQYRGGHQQTIGANLTALTGDVRAVLTARLDRLGADLKETVQRAAVLGREFDTRVLCRILDADLDAALSDRLAAGETAELWRAIEPTRYIFRHALLRDAAYDMQLRARLRHTHAAAAAAVEAVFSQQLAPRYADLVYHHNRAEQVDRERHYAELAGNHAAEEFANDDALRYLERALTLTSDDDTGREFRLLLAHEAVLSLEGMRNRQQEDGTRLLQLAKKRGTPDMQSDAYLRLGHIARVTGEYGNARESFQRAASLAAATGRPDHAIQAELGSGRVALREGDYEAAQRHLTRALSRAESTREYGMTAEIHYFLGLSDYYQGDVAGAQSHLERAAEQYRAIDDVKGQIMCRIMFGTIANDRGEYGFARTLYAGTIQQAETIGWKHAQAHLRSLLGSLDFDIGRFASARAHYTDALHLCRELVDREGEARNLDTLGLIDMMMAHAEHAERQLREAAEIQTAIHDDRGRAYTLVHLALLETEDQAEAINAIEQAHAIRQAAGDEAGMLECTAIRARFDLATGDLDRAQDAGAAIWRQLDVHGSAGFEFPALAFAVCAEIAAAAESHGQRAAAALPSAETIRARGRMTILALADHIQDEEFRRSYLEHGPFHRLLFDVTSPH